MLVLVVVVGLQRQLGAAVHALEAARVKERKVLQRTDAVHLVDDLAAAQARGFVEIGTVHDGRLWCGARSMCGDSFTA